MSTDSTPPDGASDENVPKEGDVLAGKYRIERILGQGGMGVVVAAQHTTLRQKVAVKFLLPEAARRDDAAERFLREARAAVSIHSEHVARVTDVGTLENGAPYMVMEFLTGADLGSMLDERGPMSIETTIDYVLQGCEAIAEAHSIGIIHRDLKPANLFLTHRADGSPLVKVLDFGLSKATRPDAMDATLTASNVVMGSPSYMSPEQIRSLKGLDARTDIWALGVILYQMLTGYRPFEADTLGGLFFTIGADAPVPVRTRRPDIPVELEAAVMKCLAKDPAHRTQTVAALARSLAPFAAPHSRLSIERIHRVLSDATPLPGPRDSRPDLAGAPIAFVPIAAVAPGAQIPAAPQAMQTGQVATVASAMAVPAGTGPLPLARTVAEQPPPEVKSGSMAAISKDGPLSGPPPAPAPKRAAVWVAAVASVAVLGVTGAVALNARGTTGAAATPPPLGVTAAQDVDEAKNRDHAPPAAATAAATDAPSVTVAPAETATAAAPSASADASATSATSATKKPGIGAKPIGKPAGKKSKDVLDKWN